MVINEWPVSSTVTYVFFRFYGVSFVKPYSTSQSCCRGVSQYSQVSVKKEPADLSLGSSSCYAGKTIIVGVYCCRVFVDRIPSKRYGVFIYHIR